MAVLEKYNYLVGAVVKKISIESGVKISDIDVDEMEIRSNEFPSVLMDLYHTNHQFYEEYKCNKFLVKFEFVRNPQELLSVLMPGSIVDRIHIIDNKLIVQNKIKISAKVLCSEILVKAKV